MKKRVEYFGANSRVSPACIELLIRERSKSKSLRQLGQMFGRSHERIRKLLAKYDLPQVRLLPESGVAAKLGYPVEWLTQLRKEGIINPIKRGFWLYSEEQVRQIPSLIAEARKCQQCGKPRPLHFRRFCRECWQYRKKNRYQFLSPEKKAAQIKRNLAWKKANPEKVKEINSRANRKLSATCRTTKASASATITLFIIPIAVNSLAKESGSGMPLARLRQGQHTGGGFYPLPGSC